MTEGQRKLQLRSGYMVVPGETSIHIRSLRRTLLLRGQHASTLLPQVLSALDGVRTVDEVAATLSPSDTVLQVVSLLDKAGLLEESVAADSYGIPTGFRALLDGIGADISAVAIKLKTAKVGLLTNPEFAPYISEALMAFGLGSGQITVVDEPSSWRDQIDQIARDSTVLLAALPGWQPDLFMDINQACVKAGTPWLPVQSENEVSLLIGPFVVPGETACYACFERRRRANLMDSAQMQAAFDSFVASQPDVGNYRLRSVRTLLEPAFSMATIEVLKYAVGLDFYLSTVNRVISFTPFAMEMESMPVLKVPRCPVCSTSAKEPTGRVWMGV